MAEPRQKLATPAGKLATPDDEFRIGEKVLVEVDWGSGLHRNKRFMITGFQMNGRVKYARGFWTSSKYASQLKKEYGEIFPILDLKKLDK